LGGNAARRTLEIDGKIVHDPGPAQAVRPLESGVRGCTLVEVDTSGSAKMAFLPTCSVRYEQLSVRVFPETTREMLVQAMVRALKAVERFPTDKVWLVAWNVSGAGDLIDALSPGRARDEILAAASTKGDVPGVHVHSHAVRLYRTGVLAPPAADELTGEFDARLTSGFAETTWTPARCLAESPLRGGPWQNPLGILLSELDEREVARDARQVGRDWFAPQEEPLS
jgi:hypothetical protein